MLFGDFSGFGNGGGDISSLCRTDTDFVLAVTNNHESAETKAAAAFDNPSYPVNVQSALIVLLFFLLNFRATIAPILGFLCFSHI
jgi:hypothetical protein